MYKSNYARLSCLVTFLVSRPEAASGQFRPPPKEATTFSDSKQFFLKMTPGSMFQPGSCRAELCKMDGHIPKLVWSRPLVNDYAPLRMFTSDSGRYVVTIGEWNRRNVLLVVIYGEGGRLVSVLSRCALGLTKEEYIHDPNRDGDGWNTGSVAFFAAEDELFCIRLDGGRLIIIELKTGELLGGELSMASIDRSLYERSIAAVERALCSLCTRLLASKDLEERASGIAIAREHRIHDAIPLLRNIATENPSAPYKFSSTDESVRCSLSRSASTAIDEIEGADANLVPSEVRKSPAAKNEHSAK